MWPPNAKRVNLGANVQSGPFDDMRRPKICHRVRHRGRDAAPITATGFLLLPTAR